MTRDELVTACKDLYEAHVTDTAGNFVDALVARGLKLDEPKTREQHLIAKACSIGAIKAREWNKVQRALDLAGLKIVEKD